MRGNQFSDSKSTNEYIQELLDLPDQMEVQCIVAIGYADEEIAPYTEAELVFDRVNYGRFAQQSPEN